MSTPTPSCQVLVGAGELAPLHPLALDKIKTHPRTGPEDLLRPNRSVHPKPNLWGEEKEEEEEERV